MEFKAKIKQSWKVEGTLIVFDKEKRRIKKTLIRKEKWR